LEDFTGAFAATFTAAFLAGALLEELLEEPLAAGLFGVNLGMDFPGLAAFSGLAATCFGTEAVLPRAVERFALLLFVVAIGFGGAQKIERDYLAAFRRACKGNMPDFSPAYELALL
jgi:hypothetical protein